MAHSSARFTVAALSMCMIVSLAVAPKPASAFKDGLQAQSGPVLQPEKNRKVIVLDNDLLDRRFGRSRGTENGTVENGSRTAAEENVYIFGGPQIVDVRPRRSSDVSPKGSLLKGIKRGTPARRAAALRLAETGRTLLRNGDNQKAIYHLEKALGIDTSPFIHFYLAQAHFQLADHQEALRFLQVAESGLYGDEEWQPEVAAFKEALSGSPLRRTIPHNIAWIPGY